VTCTIDRGHSISEVATTIRLIVLDEDDNIPTAQINKHWLNGSKLKAVSCMFLVDFPFLWLSINRKNHVTIREGMLKKMVIASYLYTDHPLLLSLRSKKVLFVYHNRPFVCKSVTYSQRLKTFG
jgi:hypothetical protein